MPNTINYATQFDNKLRELYGQELTSDALFHSNLDINIIGAKDIKIPKLSVSGYKDHNRSAIGFNGGSYANDYETKTLDHDRDIEFGVDPMDVDETNTVLSTANIHNRFEKTQAIPELDCYTFSKIYTEAVRVGAVVKDGGLNVSNVLSDFDDNLVALEDAGVPLDRVILFCTSAYKKLLKNANGIERTLDVSKGGGIDRRVHSIDDIGTIVTVPSARLKTAFDFTNGCIPASTAKNIDYILIDPECQVSRVKYSYIHFFAPGTDSRTADKYLYQNRRYNGTFAIDELMRLGCIIHTESVLAGITVEPESGSTTIFGTSVSNIQSDVTISGDRATGTLKYLSSGAIATDWGAGNFIALKLSASDWSAYTSVKVGLEPSQSSGLVEIKNDPDKNGVFKITNKDIQRFKIVATNGTYTKVQYINLDGLTCEGQ